MPDTQKPTTPTPRQQRYLRTLAQRTGTTFVDPSSKAQARRLIRELLARERTPHGDIARERHELSRDMSTRRGDAAQIRPSETVGYGSSATWSLHAA